MGALWNTIIYYPLVNAFVLCYQALPFLKLPLTIFILTILLRVILYPLTAKSMHHSQQMQVLQPKIKELQKKFKGSPEKLNAEQMKLFTEHKVNPAAGCLTTLIQFPLIIALYPVFMNLTKNMTIGFFGYGQILDPALRFSYMNDILYSFVPKLSYIHFQFLMWDLSKPDPTYILPIIAGILQFFQARQMMTKTNDETQKTMNQTMMLMPLLIVMFASSLPASLAVYWIAATIVGIIQTGIIKRKSHDHKSQHPKKSTSKS